jgi:hypothetical protein
VLQSEPLPFGASAWHGCGPTASLVGLGVQHRSDVAAEALSEAAGKAQQLESLFRELEIDEGDWVAGSITLREREEWDESSRREVRQGYVASSRVDVLGRETFIGIEVEGGTRFTFHAEPDVPVRQGDRVVFGSSAVGCTCSIRRGSRR